MWISRRSHQESSYWRSPQRPSKIMSGLAKSPVDISCPFDKEHTDKEHTDKWYQSADWTFCIHCSDTLSMSAKDLEWCCFDSPGWWKLSARSISNTKKNRLQKYYQGKKSPWSCGFIISWSRHEIHARPEGALLLHQNDGNHSSQLTDMNHSSNLY